MSALQSIGDMAQHFQSLRHNTSLKSRLGTLTEEVSTGKVADISKHLGGDTRRLSGLLHSLSVLETYQQSAREVAQNLDTTQTTLSAIADTRSDLGSQLLLMNRNMPRAQLDQAAKSAADGFADIVTRLNIRSGDKSVFAGAAVDQQALLAPGEMLTDIVGSLGGATSADGIMSAIEDWFENPAGGFALRGYGGDTGPVIQQRVASDTRVDNGVKADDARLRAVMKAAAIGAVAHRLGPSLGDTDKADLLKASGENLNAGSSAITQLQAEVGFAQAKVERAQTYQAAQEVGLSLEHNKSVQADPFDTASMLKELQLQLETHYTMTARLSRLSLVEYLR